jgi:hypothetical protein
MVEFQDDKSSWLGQIGANFVKIIAFVLGFFGLLSGICAAYYWWKASRGKLPPLKGSKTSGIGINMGDMFDWMKIVESDLRQSAGLNRTAALLTAASIVCASASSFASLLA